MKTRHPSRSLVRPLVVAGIGWCVLAGWGWTQLYSYAYRPEKTGQPVIQWPCDASSDEVSAEFRIVMFVHPLCPCTQATLQELDESLTRLPEDVSVLVVPVTVGLSADEVDSSRIVEFLRHMPRVTMRFDATGEERDRFGACVSGEVFAFDRQGRRVFHGGLTPGRGHQGDAAGQRHLEALARGAERGPVEAPVFGCRLPGSKCGRESSVLRNRGI